ncbi:deoxyribose-phosphate aldolase [Streptohalobacillus salinus]|uniref:Deoxyribose-phosphate aldolase n=1 Tax=Streptohalobacillus salinus TaxID=621096 RepID=A0A2V3VXX1_9BACI|nr:deoxyribose-phosphate aldolase [Streptohalobacillus salinus]
MIKSIDYTLLKPIATTEAITTFCDEAISYGFQTVFVNPYYVKYASDYLSKHAIKVGAPIGFSLGGMKTGIKVAETQEAIKDGAQEIDMLINLGAMKSKDYPVVKRDISEVVKASEGLTTKVIIETGLLTEQEKRIASELIVEAGADFVKTATGFNGGGATVRDVEIIRGVVGPEFGIKAAGGIRSLADVEALMSAGASRIGTSSAIAIITGGQTNSAY